MLRGASLEERTDVNEERAAIIEDSGRWNAGLRLGIMHGVNTRTDGFGAGADGDG
jgi:hypothetical protein